MLIRQKPERQLYRFEIKNFPERLELTFIDKGIPYNPLENKDPDVTLDIEKRKIGGLGIFLVKEMMDEVSYEYADGKNILKLKKEFIDFIHCKCILLFMNF